MFAESQPSPSLVQSLWWQRLASFAEAQQSRSRPVEETELESELLTTSNWPPTKRKRGFRLHVRRPLFLSLRLNAR